MSLIDELDKVSDSKKALSLSAVGGLIAAAALASGNKALIALGTGLGMVGLVISIYFKLLKAKNNLQGEMLGRSLVSRGDVGPKFAAGVEAFRKSGKSLYDVPWYLMVGEPGAGKTYAIKHSNIVTKGMNDPDAGEGGTIGMDWWFASKGAVMLDTAGALLTDRKQADQFGDFLRLVRRCRPQVPINGMILAIPATALLSDTDAEMQAKAELIAQQFDFIQRELSVRFPVYVIITKSDKIEGFREYFYNFSDSSVSNQIFGWSNPASLDTAFQADQVEKYLTDVTIAIKRRRMTLLNDPKTPEDRTKRLDQTDALYAFPEQLMHVGGRLRYYLETVFMPSQWSMTPLFLRGIYFTSAVCEGVALDSDLAVALGVLPAELPPGMRAWEKNKSYFLRDLFNEKIFREKGLVTPVSTKNVDSQLRRQKLAILGAGFAAVALLAAFTIYAHVQLDRSIGRINAFWETPASDLSKLTWPAGTDATLARYTENVKYGSENVGDKVDFVFAIPRMLLQIDVNTNRKAAHRMLFEQCVLKPFYNQVARALHDNQKLWDTASVAPHDVQPQQAYVDLLGQLVLLEAWMSNTQGGALKPQPDFDRMFAALQTLQSNASQTLPSHPSAGSDAEWNKVIQASFSKFEPAGNNDDGRFSETTWLATSANRKELLDEAAASLTSIKDYGSYYADHGLQSLNKVAAAMTTYQKVEDAYLKELRQTDPKQIPTATTRWTALLQPTSGDHSNPSLGDSKGTLETSLNTMDTTVIDRLGNHRLSDLYTQSVGNSKNVMDWLSGLQGFTGVPAGAKETPDPVAKTSDALGKAIQDIGAAAQNNAKQYDKKVDELLLPLDVRLLGTKLPRHDTKSPDWSYQRRLRAYGKVAEFANGATPDSVKMEAIAGDVVEVVNYKESTLKTPEVNAVKEDNDDDYRSCIAAINIAGKYRSRLIWDLANRGDDLSTAQKWYDRVAAGKAPPLPAPGEAYVAFAVDPSNKPGMNPDNAAALFKSWQEAKDSFAGSDSEPLGKEDVANWQWKDGWETARQEYQKTYKEQWQKSLEFDATTIRAGEVLDQLSKSSGADLAGAINDNLKGRWDQYISALKAIGDTGEKEALAAPDFEMLKTDSGAFLEIWKKLSNPAVGGVRGAIIHLVDPKDFTVLQKVLPGANNPATNFATRYWLAMGAAMQDRLKHDCAAQLTAELANIKSQLKFPVIEKAEADGDMTTKQIVACKDQIGKLLDGKADEKNPLKALVGLGDQESWCGTQRKSIDEVLGAKFSIALAEPKDATPGTEQDRVRAADGDDGYIDRQRPYVALIDYPGEPLGPQDAVAWKDAEFGTKKFDKAVPWSPPRSLTEWTHVLIGLRAQTTVGAAVPKADNWVDVVPANKTGGWKIYHLICHGRVIDDPLANVKTKRYLVFLKTNDGNEIAIEIRIETP